MAKLEDEDETTKKNGKGIEAHITSLSVLRTHRKLGIATKLMRATHHQMKTYFNCSSCSLRVRVTNRAAIGLYTGVLDYNIRDCEKSYYADGEDAYDMQTILQGPKIEVISSTDEESKTVEAGVDKFAEDSNKKKKKAGETQTGPTEEKKATEPESKEDAEKRANKNKKKKEKAKAKKAATDGGAPEEKS